MKKATINVISTFGATEEHFKLVPNLQLVT